MRELAYRLLRTAPMDNLEQRISNSGPVLEALCEAMRREAATLFPREPVMIGSPASARYRLEQDPADGSDSLVGEWFDKNGRRVGMLVCHAGGQCFAEHDIVRAHPHDRHWFVEAVEAWGISEFRMTDDPLNVRAEAQGGKRPDIRAEIRLLAQP